jgi:hypothetical protein
MTPAERIKSVHSLSQVRGAEPVGYEKQPEKLIPSFDQLNTQWPN